MAGPLSIGFSLPGLVDFSISPLTGVQLRLLEALAPRPQAPQPTAAAPASGGGVSSASKAQFSPQAMTAALSEQLATRLQQLYQANPSLAGLGLQSLQVHYAKPDGPAEVIIGPLAGRVPPEAREQMTELLAAHEPVLAQFLQENDATLRQIAAANGGFVNLILIDPAAKPDAGGAPATASPTAQSAAADPLGGRLWPSATAYGAWTLLQSAASGRTDS